MSWCKFAASASGGLSGIGIDPAVAPVCLAEKVSSGAFPMPQPMNYQLPFSIFFILLHTKSPGISERWLPYGWLDACLNNLQHKVKDSTFRRFVTKVTVQGK
ncbi:hypothetical protein [Agriterribacter sp.]|uniref:hypothetical protein n=1 Tax=Agriterribacter sp. TaxID=2821509 RepID=UPI002BF83C6A|nr:hypothetical protein [Agriterribacter sp.]HRP56430.1 hypothetical protein [Agriterribacter sp.]